MPKDSTAPALAAQVRLHPHFVLRVAGEPCAPWVLHDGACGAALAAMHTLRVRMAALAAPVCDSLQRAIGAAGHDSAARRQLLAARRAVFNGKALALCETVIAAWCEPAQHGMFAQLKALGQELALAEAEFNAVYDAELAGALARLRRAVRAAPALLGGIHYTNPTLYARVARWLQADGCGDAKAARRLELTVLDFALRAAFKTSPLSSFTPVIVGDWKSTGESGAQLGGRAIRMRLQVNHTFLLTALEDLWRDPAALGEGFPLALNPTLRTHHGHMHWQQLTCSPTGHGKFWGAAHPTRKAGLSAPIRLFLGVVADLPGACNLATVSAALQQALPAQHAPDARAFAETMLALGVLHPVWPRHQQHDLLADVVALAGQLAPPAGARLAHAASALQALMPRYGQADLAERVALRPAIAAAAAALGGTGPVFFEDCSFDGARLRADPQHWQAVLDDLTCWLALQPLLDTHTALQSALAARFVAHYGADGVCHDIEAFLDALEPDFGAGAPHLAQRSELLEAATGTGQAEVQLDPGWCRDLAQSMPAAVRRRAVSQAFFGQRTGPDDGAAGFVVNRVYPGSSMMLSRFLHDLPEAELAAVRAYIGRLAPDGHCLALSGVFGFNGNLHPRLCDGEVLPAGAQPGRADGTCQPLAALRLVYNRATDRLDLHDADGTPHTLLYFGFLQARNLPPAYRLLARNVSAIGDLWEQIEQHGHGAPAQPRMLARVCLGSLVLARQTWILPRACLPDAALGGAAFARAMHALRCQWDLPAELFVRIDPRPPEAQHGPRGQWLSKPLYVHLDSPIHLRQLAAALRQAGGSVVLQEALPAPGVGTVQWQGRAHVAEMQIELTLAGMDEGTRA